MRHVITRTIIGIIWLIVAGYCLFTANYLMTVIGCAAGLVYLSSAYNMRNKEKESK